MKRLKFSFYLLFFVTYFVSAQGFDFSWSGSGRIWLGKDTWANRLQDWQLIDNEVRCMVSDWNRNVNLLTWRMDEGDGDMEMSVSLRILNGDRSSRNWVGFRIASRGHFNDYRDDALFGNGLNLGITTNGELVFDEPSEKYQKNADGVSPYLEEGIILKFKTEFIDGKYSILLSAYRKLDGSLLVQRKYNDIAPSAFHGSIALVSHFPEADDRGIPSVAFSGWKAGGSKLRHYPERAFGPVLFTKYTLSRGVMKMSAQFPPMGKGDDRYAQLQVWEDNEWIDKSRSEINRVSRTALFDVPQWNAKRDMRYRVNYHYLNSSGEQETCYYEGTVQKDPVDKDVIKVAAFTGNNDLGYPNQDLWSNVKKHKPDLLFFSGDQIYEPVGGYGLQRNPVNMAVLDYLRKWYLFGWEYGDLLRDIPSISIPDDHDVLHGNLWGDGGKLSTKGKSGMELQDNGGYKMPAVFVNMVERTQTEHLPDSYSEKVLESGIGVYYTEMVYGGVSFGIIEDRKFKSAPKILLPEADIRNGWPQNMDFDVPNDADCEGAELLGKDQLDFLDHWAADWSGGAWMKVLLSATIFNNVATLPNTAKSDAVVPKLTIYEQDEYAEGDKLVTDFDSNGWPQGGRNSALKTIRKGFAFHIAGDQHLGSSIQYGVDEFRDAGFAICVPSISNYWPRRFYPPKGNPLPGQPDYTGDFLDGFGNHMTVHAIANPIASGKEPSELYDRSTGYGIIEFKKSDRTITFANWPRFADPANDKPYRGWPITIKQEDNYGRKAEGWLPQIIIKGLDNPVIQIIDPEEKELVYTLRISGNSYLPKVFEIKEYDIRVGDPDLDKWQVLTKVKANRKSRGKLEVIF